MKMTINEKIKSVADLLRGYYALWGKDELFIPYKEIPFPIEEDFWEVVLALKKLGLVRGTPHLGYGYGLVNGKPEIFQTMGKDAKIPTATVTEIHGKKKQKKTVKLLPVYRIKINPEYWKAPIEKAAQPKTKAGEAVGNLIFEDSGLLYNKNNPQKPKPISFGKGKGRYKLLSALVEAGGASVPTDTLREIGGSKNNRNVRKEIGTIKKRIAKMIGKKQKEVIAGTEYSGYRLLIKIEKSKRK